MSYSITLRIIDAGGGSSEATFDQESLLVGRSATTVLRLLDDDVSSIHAVIKQGIDGVVSITDLGSERGTQLNGQTVTEPTALKVGDVLTFGGTRAEVVALEATAPAAVPAAAAAAAAAAVPADAPAAVPEPPAEASPTAAEPSSPVEAEPAETNVPETEASATPEAPASDEATEAKEDVAEVAPTVVATAETQEIREEVPPPPVIPPAPTGQREKQVKLTQEEPTPGANLVTENSDIDPALLSVELDEKNKPTNQEKALEISVLWGDTVVSEGQFRRAGAIRLGTRTSRPRPQLEVDGGFPVDTFTIANLADGQAKIVVPSEAKVAVRGNDGSVNNAPSLGAADAGFPSKAYDLKMGERIVYKSGTVTVMAQFVRGNAALGRGAVMDWVFPAVLAISLLLHLFFVIATFITPNINRGLIDDLFKNQNRFAQMILKAPEEEKKRKKLDLSGMKGGAKAKEDEGKFAPKDKPKKDKLASKSGAPRVDPNKREKDRKIAMNSGLLSILKGAASDSAVSNALGPGGLGTGINNAMGGLRGTEMGDAGGAGGLGTRGTGAGGGGNSLGIGGLGTHGHGRGSGGYGNIDLGGRGKGRTRIVPGRTIIKGSLSKAEIARVIRRNLARFKFCYEKQLQKNPNLGGKIAVYFTIAPTGSVARATVRETTMNDATVESCVLKVMRSLKFPKPKGGGIVVVTYPFRFAAT